MNKEEKELLLKDLCARLPYGVMCNVEVYALGHVNRELIGFSYGYFGTKDTDYEVDEIKPYLRPLSSMTEEEQVKYLQTCNGGNSSFPTIESYDWLNAHHFDYRGLIEIGLAIKAPDGMY